MSTIFPLGSAMPNEHTVFSHQNVPPASLWAAGDIKSLSPLAALAWRRGQSSTVSLIHSGREESKNKPRICFHWLSRFHWLFRQPTHLVVFPFFHFLLFPLPKISWLWSFTVSNENMEDTYTNHFIMFTCMWSEF